MLSFSSLNSCYMLEYWKRNMQMSPFCFQQDLVTFIPQSLSHLCCNLISKWFYNTGLFFFKKKKWEIWKTKKWKKKNSNDREFWNGWNLQSLLILPFHYSPQKASWQDAGMRKSRAFAFALPFHKCLTVSLCLYVPSVLVRLYFIAIVLVQTAWQEVYSKASI